MRSQLVDPSCRRIDRPVILCLFIYFLILCRSKVVVNTERHIDTAISHVFLLGSETESGKIGYRGNGSGS